MIRWVRCLLSRARLEREMREELRAHIEHRADDLQTAGLSRDEALRRARVEFGAVEAVKEDCRDARGFISTRPFHGARGDLRLATGRLLARPVLTLFAVASLAVAVASLAVGVATAAYSVVERRRCCCASPCSASNPRCALRRGRLHPNGLTNRR